MPSRVLRGPGSGLRPEVRLAPWMKNIVRDIVCSVSIERTPLGPIACRGYAGAGRDE